MDELRKALTEIYKILTRRLAKPEDDSDTGSLVKAAILAEEALAAHPPEPAEGTGLTRRIAQMIAEDAAPESRSFIPTTADIDRVMGLAGRILALTAPEGGIADLIIDHLREDTYSEDDEGTGFYEADLADYIIRKTLLAQTPKEMKNAYWWDMLTPGEFARRISQFLLDNRSSQDMAMLSKALNNFPNPLTPGHGVGEWGIGWEEIKSMCKRFGAIETEES